MSQIEHSNMPESNRNISRVLLGDIQALIDASRTRAAQAVNAELTLLFWRIGHRIQTEVLAGQRAGYGDEVVSTLASQLVAHYGRGFGEKNLRRMVKFAATFPDEPIVATVSRQLSWSHFVALLGLKDSLEREYYLQMACSERWSVRTLRERIDSLLYQRTALSQMPDETIAKELATLRDAQRMSPPERRVAARHHPLHGQEVRADRAAGVGQVRHPRRGVLDHPATSRRSDDPLASGNPACSVAGRAQRIDKPGVKGARGSR